MRSFKFTRLDALLLILAIGLLAFGFTAKAQTTQADSASNASVQNASVSISNGAPGAPGIANLNLGVSPSVTIDSHARGSDLGKSVPFVSAPQMTVLGGEDSCLKSRSGGGAFSGFGASFGTMVMDNECNRRVLSKQVLAMGQHEISLAILCGSPQFWAASARVSLFRKAKGMKGSESVCHNALPKSADVISAKIVDNRQPASMQTEIIGSKSKSMSAFDDFIY